MSRSRIEQPQAPAPAPRTPRQARLDDVGRRYYLWGDERYWSVTTLIDAGVPKYLVPWAVRLVAELVYADLSESARRQARTLLKRWTASGLTELRQAKEDGMLKTVKIEAQSEADLAMRWLKGAPERMRDAAARRGSLVHEASEDLVLENVHGAERLLLEGEAVRLDRYPDALRPYMASFMSWVHAYRPRYLMTEATVFSRRRGYAGTLDAGIELPQPDGSWEPILVDTKTGRRVYPEVGLQLSAYSRADFVGLPDGSEGVLPRFRRGAVLHLTPQGFVFKEVRIDDQIYEAFLHACQVARFRLELANSVIGETIPPPPLLGNEVA